MWLFVKNTSSKVNYMKRWNIFSHSSILYIDIRDTWLLYKFCRMLYSLCFYDPGVYTMKVLVAGIIKSEIHLTKQRKYCNFIC